MAEAAAGLILDSVSVLALFDIVQDDFHLIVSARKDFLNNSKFMLTKFQVENHRLNMWCRYMAMSDAEIVRSS